MIFSVLGAFASRRSGWLARRTRTTVWLNRSAGATLIASGLSILALGNRRSTQAVATKTHGMPTIQIQ